MLWLPPCLLKRPGHYRRGCVVRRGRPRRVSHGAAGAGVWLLGLVRLLLLGRDPRVGRGLALRQLGHRDLQEGQFMQQEGNLGL